MPRSGVAWWPGGRISAKPLRACPFSTASTMLHSPPAASRAACSESAPDVGVRVQIRAPLCGERDGVELFA